MNLLHLKYAVEIADTGSMTKAAQNLYTAQPSLSRAMRELETSLGITVFKRTPKGIFPTAEGEEFLGYARQILAQVSAVENMYKQDRHNAQTFSVSVPRASYVSCAFTEFVKQLDPEIKTEVFYKETNSMRAINNLLNENYNLGIVRYCEVYDNNFNSLFEEKGLLSELICRFRYRIIMSKSNPLAQKAVIVPDDLKNQIEIAHADPFVPSLPVSTVLKSEITEESDKRIFVFERGSQMDLLANTPNTFMWVSPVPQRMLDLYSLVEKECESNKKIYKDVLVYRKGYSFTALDRSFCNHLRAFCPSEE